MDSTPPSSAPVPQKIVAGPDETHVGELLTELKRRGFDLEDHGSSYYLRRMLTAETFRLETDPQGLPRHGGGPAHAAKEALNRMRAILDAEVQHPEDQFRK